MSEPYLILHKVRGEPAFDIAHKLIFGEEEGWIVGTSGHRAYPWFSQPLGEIVQNDLMDLFREGNKDAFPPDWPDHYSCNDHPPSSLKVSLGSKVSLASLGLKPETPIKRRKLT